MIKSIDVRWIQRFLNYKKALSQLREFVQLGKLSKFEKQGLIKSFEYTYELGWNTIKDYLYFQEDPDVSGSRDTMREGFKQNLISDGDGWMQMLQNRNRTSHTYNEDIAEEIVSQILTSYFQLFEELEKTLSEKIN